MSDKARRIGRNGPATEFSFLREEQFQIHRTRAGCSGLKVEIHGQSAQVSKLINGGGGQRPGHPITLIVFLRGPSVRAIDASVVFIKYLNDNYSAGQARSDGGMQLFSDPFRRSRNIRFSNTISILF